MDTGARSRTFRPLLRAGNRFDPLAARRPILTFENVHKAYRADAPVLRGLDLEIERGEFVFITGPSRTADIEKILILGVHGPKRLVVLLVG